MTVVGQVEIDPFCRRVLSRHWPDVPKHDDVRTAVEWWESEPRPCVDLICGGFPCQDISNAGKRAGIAGDRSGLWGAMFGTIRRLRPRYTLGENVPALLIRGFDTVLGDLASIGLNVEWSVVSACSVGAPHTRERLFFLAHHDGVGLPGRPTQSAPWAGVQQRDATGQGGHCPGWPSVPEPGTWGVASRFPHRVDRTRALGNAVVPQVAEHIGRQLMAAA
jgi:DNA (cytosine-5)-methyltransferase 1